MDQYFICAGHVFTAIIAAFCLFALEVWLRHIYGLLGYMFILWRYRKQYAYTQKAIPLLWKIFKYVLRNLFTMEYSLHSGFEWMGYEYSNWVFRKIRGGRK